MTKYILNLIACIAGAALSLWMPGVDGGALVALYAVTWTVFVGCAGYWVWAILDDCEQAQAITEMVNALEAAGVYSPEQAQAVRRDLLEQ